MGRMTQNSLIKKKKADKKRRKQQEKFQKKLDKSRMKKEAKELFPLGEQPAIMAAIPELHASIVRMNENDKKGEEQPGSAE